MKNNTTKLIIIFTLTLLFSNIFFSLPVVKAQNPPSIPILEPGGDIRKEYNESAKEMGYETSANLDSTFMKLMNFRNTVLLTISSFLGVLFLGMMLWGGYEWMFAGGNEERVTNAKKRIKMAVNGLLIVLSAYIIVSFILTIFFETAILPAQP